MRESSPEVIVHLAAQAGVRYSLENPDSYINSNIIGTQNLLAASNEASVRHILFASTSSVYGGNGQIPFKEADRTDFPVSLYAATKKAGEAITHSYSHIYQTPITCFRFFTVYGPWGRPDMALFKFVKNILDDQHIEVYGQGKMRRDFTYVGDLIDAIALLIRCPPEQGRPVTSSGVEDSLSPVAPWRVVNIGGGKPIELASFIETIESCLGTKSKKIMLPMQKGDVVATEANTGLLEALIGLRPTTPIDKGVRAFIEWYREYIASGPVSPI